MVSSLSVRNWDIQRRRRELRRPQPCELKKKGPLQIEESPASATESPAFFQTLTGNHFDGIAGAAGAADVSVGAAAAAADVSAGADVVEVGSVAGLSLPPHATEAITNAAEIKRAMFFMSSSV
jgi:hypothetical protein